MALDARSGAIDSSVDVQPGSDALARPVGTHHDQSQSEGGIVGRMKAIVRETYGSPSVLHVEDVPVPDAS